MLMVVNEKSMAQSKVTFKVNLIPQLKDSVFVPGRDQIYLTGNVYPLINSQKIYLEDVAPADSIFEATVKFPYRTRGERLQYRFIIKTPEKEIKEHRLRNIQIQSTDIELDALYFNSFAW